MSEQGERGDTGIQGAAGERGPKGDHGQHGERGYPGTPARSPWRGWPLVRALAYVFVAMAAAYGVSQYNTRSSQARFATQRTAELRICERTQFLRDQANGTNILIFDTFNRLVKQQKAAIASGKLQSTALKQAKDAVRRGEKVVRTTVVTGPTDCKAATDHPDKYVAPAPEFIVNDTARVRSARRHAQAIVEKAKTKTPLYRPGETG
jgi:hypothetical protein